MPDEPVVFALNTALDERTSPERVPVRVRLMPKVFVIELIARR